MKIVFIIYLFMSFSLYAAQETEIERLISAELTTIARIKNPGFRIMHRKLELLAEKLKIVHTQENKIFINNPNQKSFKKTQKLYLESLHFGKSIIKRFTKHRDIGQVYYTLALNARDYKPESKLEYRYLNMAIKYSRKNSQLRYQANTSLAEYFYNNKKYNNAIAKYQRIIKNQEDDWYTKNLLNYAWCLFKAKKFHKAIQLMEDAFVLSLKPKYIDVSEQAIKALTTFYVFSKEINRGVSFIKQNSPEILNHLFDLAKKSSKKGFYKNAHEILLSIIKESQDETQTIEYKLFLLGMYQQYKKDNLFIEQAISFKQYKLQDSAKDEIVHIVLKTVQDNQILLKKQYDSITGSYSRPVLKNTIKLFNLLNYLEKNKFNHYQFLIGETYYSVGEDLLAYQSYKKIIEKNDANKFNRLKKTFVAIYSSLEKASLSSIESQKELDYIYTKHLFFWPKSNNAQKIYPRLFTLQVDQDRYEESFATLKSFIGNYPTLKKTQQDLYKNLLQHLIKEKDTANLSLYIANSRTIPLDFKQDFIKKVETILASFLFEIYDRYEKDKKYDKAITGYQSIYFKENYPDSVRAESAFLAAISFYKSNDHNETLKWLNKSFDLLASAEKSKKRNIIENIAIETSYKQRFLFSEKYSLFILSKFCGQKKNNISTFKNLVNATLANDFIDKTLYLQKKYKHCILDHNQELNNIAEHLFTFNHYNQFIQLLEKNQHYYLKNASFPTSQWLTNILWRNYFNGQDYDKALRLLSLYSKDEAKSLKLQLTQLNLYKKNNQVFLKNKINISDITDLDLFMQKLQERLKGVELQSSSNKSLLKTENPYITFLTLKEYISFLQKVTKEFENYQSFKIQDTDLQGQLIAQLSNISQGFMHNSKLYQNELSQLLSQNEIIIPSDDTKNTFHMYTYDFLKSKRFSL